MKIPENCAEALFFVGAALILLAAQNISAAGVATKCQMGQVINRNLYSYSIDPQGFPVNSAYVVDSLSPYWLNSPGKMMPNRYWTASTTNYMTPDNSKNFAIKSKKCSRDVEVNTWMRNGYVFLRLTPDGKAIYFLHNGETTNGYLAIGIASGVGEKSYGQGSFYSLYINDNLVDTAEGYTKLFTDGHYFTFGVDGFDIYAKFNGKEFARFREYRAMDRGSVALKANVLYGFRKTTVRHREPTPLSSDYEHNVLNLRDFGLREIQTIGSIEAGSNLLTLSTLPPISFKNGDSVIIEVGGESGQGLRGAEGAGGTWPELSYEDPGQMKADTTQPQGIYAWIKADGSVYQWWNGVWQAVDPVTQYYVNKVYPLALRAKIVGISEKGRALTLSSTAKVTAVNANIYLDSSDALKKLVRRPTYDGEMNFPVETAPNDLTQITPQMTLNIPAGNFAISGEIRVSYHPGWKLVGQGAEKTKLFSPNGVQSASITFDASPNAEIRDLHLQGNARFNGYGLNITQKDIPQGSAYPHGIKFYGGSDNGRALNLRVTDVFQSAVGSSFSNNVWAYNTEAVLTEGLRRYVQWLFQWADSNGGGCKRCTVRSPILTAGFEAFKSTGVQFVNCSGTNATMAMNAAGDFLIEGANLTILPHSQLSEVSFSQWNPVININTNILNQGKQSISGQYALCRGGIIIDTTITETGYINTNNDVLKGIVINRYNPNISIINSKYSSPDYASPSKLIGAEGLHSTGENTFVYGFQVMGKVRSESGYTNIYIRDGTIQNSIAERIQIEATRLVDTKVCGF